MADRTKQHVHMSWRRRQGELLRDAVRDLCLQKLWEDGLELFRHDRDAYVEYCDALKAEGATSLLDRGEASSWWMQEAFWTTVASRVSSIKRSTSYECSAKPCACPTRPTPAECFSHFVNHVDPRLCASKWEDESDGGKGEDHLLQQAVAKHM